MAKKKSDKSAAKNHVDLLVADFEEAKSSLNQFVASKQEWYDSLDRRVTEYNIALDRLKRAVRTGGKPAGPFTKVITLTKRSFDGKFLYRLLKGNKKGRGELITVTFSVNPKVFDRLVKEGVINPDQAKKAVLQTDKSVQIRESPPVLVLG